MTEPRKELLAKGVEIWLGDCRDVLPTIDYVDAVVTDPPYGIGESAKRNFTRKKAALPGDYGLDDWDQKPADPEILKWCRANSRWQIVFGGNYFDLPPSSCWLVWDKKSTGDFADCELARTNLPKAVRRIEWMWNGMIRKGQEPRYHLTQKPLGVMEWCLDQLPPEVAKICDPYCGSGTTGVAAVKRNWKFIGVEREVHHFDTSCRRIADALKRPDLFIDRPPPAKQENLF